MTPLKIGIVEDDLIVARSISALLKKIGYSPIKPVRNYADAVKMIQNESPDLILIDIILESEPDGIELAAKVNKQFGIPFIFLTANSDPATVNRAKEVKPYAYLVKPFYEKELYSSIEIAFDNYNHQRNLIQNNTSADSKVEFSDSIFIKENNVFTKVLLSNILYIESEHVYLNIYTSDKHYVVRTKLEDFVNNYPAANLIRVHRSYAINVNYLESIGDASLIVAGRKVPINQAYKHELLKTFNRLT